MQFGAENHGPKIRQFGAENHGPKIRQFGAENNRSKMTFLVTTHRPTSNI